MFIPRIESEYELVVEKSRFIAIMYPFTNVKDLDNLLNKVKETYPKARHYLYAYKINSICKSNDDGEPGSIARGFLELINKKEIDQVLIVVVRYFGGVKLGASRLLRTYLNSVNELIKNSSLSELAKFFVYEIECDYSTFNKLKSNGFVVDNVRYNDTIKLSIISKSDIFDVLKNYRLKIIERKETIREL